MQKSVYLLVFNYAPYSHNNLSEDTEYKIFDSRYKAIVCMNDTFKQATGGEEPKLIVKNSPNGMKFLLSDSCLTPCLKNFGGYINSIEMIEQKVI